MQSFPIWNYKSIVFWLDTDLWFEWCIIIWKWDNTSEDFQWEDMKQDPKSTIYEPFGCTEII